MSALNQQTLADLRANDRPPMLEKGSYIPWESRFRRFLDNNLEDGERMWRLIEKEPYLRPMIPDPDNTGQQIIEPLSKMIEINKKHYIAEQMWEQIKRLMYGSDITNQGRHSRLMDEFDKFVAKEGESLESVYERLTTLVNIMDRNGVHPIRVSINTMFLNCLQPEWRKYVTMIRHNQTVTTISYDQLYDSLLQFKPHDQTSKAKRATRNHDPLALIAHSNAYSSQSHASPSYSHSPQPYYVTHPSSIDGRVDIQIKNAGYSGNGNRNAGRQNRNQAFNAGNGLTQQHDETMKDEAGSNLKDEENDFMLDNSYRDETLEELTDAVNASHKMISKGVHEHKNHGKRKTVINTSDDDQIDSNIIFDDPYVENNGGTSEHDSNNHDPYDDIQILAYNVQREAGNKKRLNNELQKQKELLQMELETSKKAFKERENQYLIDIVDLQEKLSSHDRIVYKMGQSIQTIHMLGKIPNKVYDPFQKAGLGYQNAERLKKVIAAQQKMYHGEML
ncbi:hypothetical protein Tco_0224005 [Tanacetum coccineum]